MGKTVGAILTIGVGVALNAIPGVGQFVGGTLIGGTLAGAGVYATTAYGIGMAVFTGLSLGAAGLALQSATGLLGLGPNMPKPDTTSTAIKTSRPPRVSAYGQSRLYPAYVLYENNGEGRAVDVGAVHDGEMSEFVRAYLNDDRITVGSSGSAALNGGNVAEGTDGRYGGNFIQLYWTNGSIPGTPIANVITQLPGIWTSDHRGDGVVMLGLVCSPVKSEDFLDIYPNGVPTPSLVGKWQRCPDPFAADPTDEDGWTWTENVIRQLMHYKMVREGVDYALKIAPALDYWKAAAAICDEDVALKAGGTEKRYRSCLSHKQTDKNGAVSDALLAACDGWMAPRADGALVVFAGRYTAPTVSIGPEHIVAYDWSYGVDDDEANNELICSYVSADHDYTTVECDAWRDEADIAARGQILSDGLDPQVPSWGQVRRLAKRRMARTNAPYRGTVTTNTAGRIVRGHRYIYLNLTDAGTTFFSGPVEIVALTRNLMTGGVTFSWVAANPAIDAWNPATEEGEPAAKGDRVAPQPLTAPTITDADPIFYEYGAQIAMDVSGPDRTDLTWHTRWRVTGDPVWNEQQAVDTDPGAGVTLVSPIVPSNVSIDVEAAYSVGDGRTSPWSATVIVSTSTAGIAPNPPTEVTATGDVGEADVTWRNPATANLSYVRVFRNTTTDFNTATAISGEIVGGLGQVMTITDTGLAAGTFYYWVAAFNSSDVASSPAGPATATVN